MAITFFQEELVNNARVNLFSELLLKQPVFRNSNLAINSRLVVLVQAQAGDTQMGIIDNAGNPPIRMPGTKGYPDGNGIKNEFKPRLLAGVFSLRQLPLGNVLHQRKTAAYPAARVAPRRVPTFANNTPSVSGHTFMDGMAGGVARGDDLLPNPGNLRLPIGRNHQCEQIPADRFQRRPAKNIFRRHIPLGDVKIPINGYDGQRHPLHV